MALWPGCHHYFAISWIKPSEPWFSLSLSLSPGLLDFFHHLYKACVQYKAFYANSPFSNFMAPPPCIHNQNKRHDKKLLWGVLGHFRSFSDTNNGTLDCGYQISHLVGKITLFVWKFSRLVRIVFDSGPENSSLGGSLRSYQPNPTKNKCVSEVFSYHDRIKVKATFKSWQGYWTERCTFHLFHAGEV